MPGNTGHDPALRTGRNTAFALASQFAGAGFTAALTLYLLRALDPEEFGLFSLALAVSALAAFLADFGIAQSTARFVAEHRLQPDAVARVLGDALRLKLLTGGLAAIGLVAAAGPIAEAYDAPGLAPVLRTMAAALVGQSLMLFFTYSFNAQGRFGTSLRIVFSESACETGFSIALVALGGGAVGAAAGRAIGYAVGGGIGLALTLRLVGRGFVSVRGAGESRRIARYAGALLVVDAAYLVFEQIDVLLIGAFLGAASAGVFQAPLRLIGFLKYPAMAITAARVPQLAGARPDGEVLAAATRYTILFQSLLLAPVVVWATPIMHLLAPGYEHSALVLRALAPYVFLGGFGLLFSLAANYLGEARRRIPIALGALAINLVLDVALIPTIGIVGAAVGTGAAFAFYAPAHLWICLRFVRLPLAELARTLARSLVAAAAMAVVLAAFGTGDLAPWRVVVGGLLGVATFATVLLALGELRPELRRVASAVRA